MNLRPMALMIAVLVVLAGCSNGAETLPTPAPTTTPTTASPMTPTPEPTSPTAEKGTALYAAEALVVSDKRMGGYERIEFGQAWRDVDRNGCDQRNDVLRRDLRKRHTKPGTNGCVLLRGVLDDPYFPDVAGRIDFERGDGEVEEWPALNGTRFSRPGWAIMVRGSRSGGSL
jgi:hypothetical protein